MEASIRNVVDRGVQPDELGQRLLRLDEVDGSLAGDEPGLHSIDDRHRERHGEGSKDDDVDREGDETDDEPRVVRRPSGGSALVLPIRYRSNQ